MKEKLGLAITGSFCTFAKLLDEMKILVKKYELIPIFSFNTANTDTRFFQAVDFRKEVTDITGKEPIDTIPLAEPVGPQNLVDIMIVAPCTGNTLAKIAHGIVDTPVTMAVKSHLRNNKPVIIALSTNDGLGNSLKNVGFLMPFKNIFFVPFRQDDFAKKPNSLVADLSLIEDTIENAKLGKQIQPILLNNIEIK